MIPKIATKIIQIDENHVVIFDEVSNLPKTVVPISVIADALALVYLSVAKYVIEKEAEEEFENSVQSEIEQLIQ